MDDSREQGDEFGRDNNSERHLEILNNSDYYNNYRYLLKLQIMYI